MPSTRTSRIRSVTPGQLLVAGALVALLCVIVRRGGDPDIFWHLATGQWMFDHHQLVTHDLFTYTVAGKQWIDAEYATEIVAYAAFKVGGLTLVSLAFGAVTFAGFILIWRRVRLERATPMITAVVLGIAGLAGAAVWGPRPQMITFTFTCLEVFWLDRYLRGRSRAVYWLPLVMVAWANLHGGFLFGLLPVAVAAFVEAIHWIRRVDGTIHRRRTRNLAVTFVGCCLAAAVNPHGINLYAYVIQPQFSPVQQSFIAEWQSPNFHMLEERGLELMLLLVPIAFVLRRPSLWDVCLTVVVTVAALAAVRHAALFVAAETPLIIWSLSSGWERTSPARRVAAWMVPRSKALLGGSAALLIVVVLGTGVFVRSTLADQAAATAANFPLGASDWLAAHPTVGTRMFNQYAWGGYLINRFYPEPNRRVFSFGEATLLGNALMQQVSDVETGQPDWQRILAQYGVDYVIDVPNAPEVDALSVDPSWTKVYDDGLAVILVKNSALTRATTSR
ncbi:MAG TPA: hypothetical protein VND54_00185 [Candidatus Saccharimonadales bacterium]|nr:hypothetical protein [Candidatus Saccharimonadales bacterium]